MNRLSLLVIIDSESMEKKHTKILDKLKIKFKTITHGVGTASSSVLSYFGLDEEEKIVILSIIPDNLKENLLQEILDKCDMHKPGKGIAFTIPLSSSPKYMIDAYYKEESKGEKNMPKKNNLELIVTIVNDGYADTVSTAAKKAGANGGTTIHGRGLDTEKAIKFLGIQIEEEKDIVLIITPSEKKKEVMDAIVKSSGLKTKGAGICFSLPVDSAIGLSENI